MEYRMDLDDDRVGPPPRDITYDNLGTRAHSVHPAMVMNGRPSSVRLAFLAAGQMSVQLERTAPASLRYVSARRNVPLPRVPRRRTKGRHPHVGDYQYARRMMDLNPPTHGTKGPELDAISTASVGTVTKGRPMPQLPGVCRGCQTRGGPD
ncbi:hypothetical protein PMIN03_010989 [Paraphaeosphaeria minitans]